MHATHFTLCRGHLFTATHFACLPVLAVNDYVDPLLRGGGVDARLLESVQFDAHFAQPYLRREWRRSSTHPCLLLRVCTILPVRPRAAKDGKAATALLCTSDRRTCCPRPAPRIDTLGQYSRTQNMGTKITQAEKNVKLVNQECSITRRLSSCSEKSRELGSGWSVVFYFWLFAHVWCMCAHAPFVVTYHRQPTSPWFLRIKRSPANEC